jgi:hypothetical protein
MDYTYRDRKQSAAYSQSWKNPKKYQYLALCGSAGWTGLGLSVSVWECTVHWILSLQNYATLSKRSKCDKSCAHIRFSTGKDKLPFDLLECGTPPPPPPPTDLKDDRKHYAMPQSLPLLFYADLFHIKQGGNFSLWVHAIKSLHLAE